MSQAEVKTTTLNGVEIVAIKDAARIIGISPKTLYGKLRTGLLDGQLDAVRCPVPPYRAYGVALPQLEAFLAKARGDAAHD